MTSPDMDDEAMKAMAREIVAKDYERFGDYSSAKAARAGDEDGFSQMRCTLAAIIETRDRDAALADEYEHMVAGKEIAAAIRSGQQFRKDGE